MRHRRDLRGCSIRALASGVGRTVACADHEFGGHAVIRAVTATTLAVCALALLAEPAGAGDDQPILRGYTRCGIQLAGEDSWHLDFGSGGAFVAAWARGGLSCTAARRNTLRVLRSQRLRLPGYRCITLRSGVEFLSLRCTKRDGSGRAFRALTAA